MISEFTEQYRQQKNLIKVSADVWHQIVTIVESMETTIQLGITYLLQADWQKEITNSATEDNSMTFETSIEHRLNIKSTVAEERVIVLGLMLMSMEKVNISLVNSQGSVIAQHDVAFFWQDYVTAR